MNESEIKNKSLLRLWEKNELSLNETIAIELMKSDNKSKTGLLGMRFLFRIAR